MSAAIAVTPLAGDGRECRLAELIVGAGNEVRGIRVAKDAALRDRVGEIENTLRLVTSQIAAWE